MANNCWASVVVAACVALALSIPQCTANPDAKRLYDDLLSTYNRLIRPVSNNNDTVLVKLGLRLSQLIELVIIKSRDYTPWEMAFRCGWLGAEID